LNNNLTRFPIGSSSALFAGLAAVLLVGLLVGCLSDWESTWRSFGVTPLKPHFFDAHGVTDHIECATKGFDAYIATACNPTPFNYPPIWLTLKYLGINTSHSNEFAIAGITVAATILILLTSNSAPRSAFVTFAALISPSVLMAVERANVDLPILALTGGAALAFDERKLHRLALAFGLLQAGVILKLYPIFCVSLLARPSRRSLWITFLLGLGSLIYFVLIFDQLAIIRHNTPTTFMLSYGYLVPFLGIDHLREEARLSGLALGETWLPLVWLITTLVLSTLIAVVTLRDHPARWTISPDKTGTSFLFGAGIYCGTYMLGTNFIYRLVFLVLCLGQLLKWADIPGREGVISGGLLGLILLALWTSGNANGHSTFVLLPQFMHWVIFFGLMAILLLNLFESAARFYRGARG